MAEATARRIEPEAELVSAPISASVRKDLTLELEHEVQAHGETLKKLVFRLPTGADLMTLTAGWPVNIDWPTGNVSPNPAVMGQMMSTLASVPPSTIKMMGGKDFTNGAHLLMGFFTPGSQAMQF